MLCTMQHVAATWQLAVPSAGLRHSTVDTGTEECGQWGHCGLECKRIFANSKVRSFTITEKALQGPSSYSRRFKPGEGPSEGLIHKP